MDGWSPQVLEQVCPCFPLSLSWHMLFSWEKEVEDLASKGIKLTMQPHQMLFIFAIECLYTLCRQPWYIWQWRKLFKLIPSHLQVAKEGPNCVLLPSHACINRLPCLISFIMMHGGPSPCAALTALTWARYYVSFIDDHTRHTSFYIKLESEEKDILFQLRRTSLFILIY